MFVGHADGDPREFAERLHAALVAPSHSVLVMVDPAARVIEVVTGSVVSRTLTDDEVELAVLEMQSAFAAGDLRRRPQARRHDARPARESPAHPPRRIAPTRRGASALRRPWPARASARATSARPSRT